MTLIPSADKKEFLATNKKKCVLRACPGSGKTFSVAAKAVSEGKKWKHKHRGIAVLSFTNIACEEISTQIENFSKTAKIKDYPHYIGTIDGFLNKYIFLPFGHKIMKCKNRPILVGPPHGTWHSTKGLMGFFDKLSFDKDDALTRKASPQSFMKDWEKYSEGLTRMKKNLHKAGYATQADANYISLKTLNKFPRLAKIIATRFPTIIIDEAQDTCAIQMKIFDKLIRGGANSVFIIGDPDQAIFEWNDATTDLFEGKSKEWDSNCFLLNNNRRSSRKICDFTFHLSSLKKPSKATNQKVSNFEHEPQVIGYKDSDYAPLVEHFLKECKNAGITVDKKVAIITRSRAILNDLLGAPKETTENQPWKVSNLFTKNFCEGCFLYNKGEQLEGLKKIEKGVGKFVKGEGFCSLKDIKILREKIGFAKWRRMLGRLALSLPEPKGALEKWVAKANEEISTEKHLDKLVFKLKKGHGKETFEEVFENTPETKETSYRTGTIHSAKGETFEATMVIIKKKGAKGKHYKTLLKENALTCKNDELRTVYVGITRPRKLLVLAVPEADTEDWKGYFKQN